MSTLLDPGQAIKGAYDDSSASFKVLPLGVIVPSSYDYIALTYYVGGFGDGQIETVTYKSGGSGGTTVATLTLTYDSNSNLASVTRS